MFIFDFRQLKFEKFEKKYLKIEKKNIKHSLRANIKRRFI